MRRIVSDTGFSTSGKLTSREIYANLALDFGTGRRIGPRSLEENLFGLGCRSRGLRQICG